MGEEGEEAENFSADEVLLGSALQGDVEGIEYALEHGANLGARDGEGNSALLLAVSCGHKKATKHLLRLGIPINDVNEFGEGVLHLCFGSGMAELGTYLITHGADTAAVTAEGLDWAMFAEAVGQDLSNFKDAMRLGWEAESNKAAGRVVMPSLRFSDDEEEDDDEDEDEQEGRWAYVEADTRQQQQQQQRGGGGGGGGGEGGGEGQGDDGQHSSDCDDTNYPSPASVSQSEEERGSEHRPLSGSSVTFADHVVDVGFKKRPPTQDRPFSQGSSVRFEHNSPAASGYMGSEEAISRLGTGDALSRLGTGVSRTGASSRASSRGTSRPTTALLGYDGEIESSAGDSNYDYHDRDFGDDDFRGEGEGEGEQVLGVLEEELRAVEEVEEEEEDVDISIRDGGSRKADVILVPEDELRAVEEEGEEEDEDGEEDVVAEGGDIIGFHDDGVKLNSAGDPASVVNMDVSGAVTSMRAKLKELEDDMKGLKSGFESQKMPEISHKPLSLEHAPRADMSGKTIGEKPKCGREMWGGLDEDSIELEAAELGLVEGSDYFSVQQCYEEIVKQEIGARHPSMHETLEGMEYHVNRILTANPVPSEKMSLFEQIIDPTPESLTDQMNGFRFKSLRGVERRIMDGVAVIMFNAVDDGDRGGFYHQVVQDIEKVTRMLHTCGFSQIELLEHKTRAETLDFLRKFEVALLPGGNLCERDGLCIAMLGSGDVLSLDCRREEDTVSSVLQDKPVRLQEMIDMLRGALIGRPKIVIHHVTASPKERRLANVDYSLRPSPGPLSLYQEVADSIGDCMIIVCTVREQVHWAKKAGSIWLEFLARVWEEMHRHLDSEDMMSVIRERIRGHFILRKGNGPVNCPQGIKAYENFFVERSMFVKSRDFKRLMLGPSVPFSSNHTQFPWEIGRSGALISKAVPTIVHIHAVSMAWPSKICDVPVEKAVRVAWEFDIQVLSGSFDLSVGAIMEKDLNLFTADRNDRSFVLASEFASNVRVDPSLASTKPPGTAGSQTSSTGPSRTGSAGSKTKSTNFGSSRPGTGASGNYKRGQTPESMSEDSLLFKHGWCISSLGGVFPGPLGYCDGYGSGSKVEIWIDNAQGTVQFMVDGQHTGHVFENTPTGQKLVPAVTAGPYTNAVVELSRAWIW